MTNLNNQNAMWVTWEVQPRNRSMARLLGADLHEIIFNQSRLIKYPILILRTLLLIAKQNPKVLFVQNPSIVLAYIVVLAKKIFSYRLIIDAHNAGIYPLEGKSGFLNAITKIICSHADMTIVTNQALAQQVEVWGGKYFVMPDPLPIYETKRSALRNTNIKTFLLICTWSDDEPFHEIIKAAELLQGKIVLKITGKYQKKLTQDFVLGLSKNIELLGFVSEEQYTHELSLADFTIDLTTRENCLVCGAYESISMEVPGVLTDTSANRSTFEHGFIFTNNDVESVKIALEKALDQYDFYLEDILRMKTIHMERVNSLKDKLKNKAFG